NCPPLPSGFPLEAERWPRIVTDARRLLGRPHHLSIHPGGVVFTPRAIEEYVPLQLAPKGIVITQFDKDDAEHIGLVKIDLLGNRALGTVDEAMRLGPVRKNPLQIANCKEDTNPKRQRGRLANASGWCAAKLQNDNLQFAISSPEDPATVALLQGGDTL